MLNFLIPFVLLNYINGCLGKIQCLDQNNEPVDWYVVFKHPRLDSTDSLLRKGASYMYMTSKTLDQGWTWSPVGIDGPDTLLANTLSQYYNKSSEGFWMLYNDQQHKFIWTLSGGHTKGAVGADKTGGIWLVQSVPKYPPKASKGYSYPSNGYVHGQSALCMSLTPQSMDDVGKALIYNDANIYGSRVEGELENLYPNLAAALKGSGATASPWYIELDLTTAGGTSFTAFAKAKEFKKDLYELVAAELQTDLLTETWQNVPSPLPSSCSNTYKIMNIKGIGIKDRNLYYHSSSDHSKWAIGTKSPWTCVGDINRAKHQLKRGGGTVCIKNHQLWQQYYAVVNEIEKC